MSGMADAAAPTAPTAPPAGWETPWPAADDAKREFARLKKRRSRWGSKAEPPPPAPAPDAAVQARLAALTDELASASEPRRAELEAERRALLQQLVSARFGAAQPSNLAGLAMMPAAPSRVILKFTLPDNTCPGGVNNLMGLIIGPRGKTQQRLQEETNTVVAIRGRGTKKLADATPTAEDDEPMFVKITGESEAACRKCLAMIETLIDFTSDEGQQFRDQQTRLLHQLNGTIREDERAVVDYKRILFEGKKATAPGGAFGSAPRLFGPGGGAAPQGFVAAGAIGGTAAPEVSAMQAGLAAIDALAAAPWAHGAAAEPVEGGTWAPAPKAAPAFDAEMAALMGEIGD